MKDIKNSIISSTSTIKDALEAINNSAAKIALVENSDHKLLGVITDGDIRRAVLKSKSLNTSVTEVMNKKFISVLEGEAASNATKQMKNIGTNYLPVIDKEGKLIDLLSLKETQSKIYLPNHIVIMAGGKGTRLRPSTESCPKPMLKIAGKPMLEIILEKCISSGFKHFYFSVNYSK